MYTLCACEWLFNFYCVCFHVPVAARGKGYSETYLKDLIDIVLPAVEVGLPTVLWLYSHTELYVHVHIITCNIRGYPHISQISQSYMYVFHLDYWSLQSVAVV